MLTTPTAQDDDTSLQVFLPCIPLALPSSKRIVHVGEVTVRKWFGDEPGIGVEISRSEEPRCWCAGRERQRLT
jgi:hypothetical protein